jgi:hypothetical protein
VLDTIERASGFWTASKPRMEVINQLVNWQKCSTVDSALSIPMKHQSSLKGGWMGEWRVVDTVSALFLLCRSTTQMYRNSSTVSVLCLNVRHCLSLQAISLFTSGTQGDFFIGIDLNWSHLKIWFSFVAFGNVQGIIR